MLAALASSMYCRSARNAAARASRPGASSVSLSRSNSASSSLSEVRDRHIKVAAGFEELLAIAEGMAAIALVRQRRKEEPRPLAQLLREQVNLRRAFLAAQQHIGIARKILEAHI